MMRRGPARKTVAKTFAGLHDGTLAILTARGECRSVMRG